MKSLDQLAKELYEEYGDFMKTTEVARRLRSHPNTVKLISEQRLPRLVSAVMEGSPTPVGDTTADRLRLAG